MPLPEPGSLAGVGRRPRQRDRRHRLHVVGPTDRAVALGSAGRRATLPAAVERPALAASTPAAYAVGIDRYPSTDGTEITLFTAAPRRRGARPDHAHPAHRLRRVRGHDEPGVQPDGGGRGRRRRRLRRGLHPGRVRGRRGLAPGRHARAQAAGVRRLRGGRRLAGGRGPHRPRPPGRPRRQQRRPAGGRHARPSGPDLCRAAVCAVPLTDMVRFPRFLIARLWTPEYGDPDVAEEFAWLWAYSPYHHLVEGTCYPAHAGADRRGGQPGRPGPRPQVRRRAGVGDELRRRTGRCWCGSSPGPATARASRPPSRPTRPPTCTPSCAGRSASAPNGAIATGGPHE